MKILNFLLIFFLFSLTSLSFANPFVELQADKSVKEKKNDKKTDIKKTDSMPPLPDIATDIIRKDTQNIQKQQWSIIGKINDNIVVTDGKDERLVSNGDDIGGCVIQYPDILCGEKKEEIVKTLHKTIADLKKHIENIQKKK